MITYLKGDATYPIAGKKNIIVHICNDCGAWGKGFVLAISKRWSAPKKQFVLGSPARLGTCQIVQVEDNIWVANIIGQSGIYKDAHGNAPIRYKAIKKGLEIVYNFAREQDAVLHMPRIGCGLAGGTWDKIEPMLDDNFETYVYDYER
jgi:O-acetyl-ADP-ribose deacetylase (regulator of RNase III)